MDEQLRVIENAILGIYAALYQGMNPDDWSRVADGFRKAMAKARENDNCADSATPEAGK